MDTLLQDLRYAVRSLSRAPVASAAAILCLALGIGATATMFSVLDSTLLRPLPFAQPDRLTDLWSANLEQGRRRATTSYQDFVDWRSHARSFQAMAGVQLRSLAFSDTDEPERVQGAAVSAGLFRLLGITPVLGRDFIDADDRPGAPGVVVVSDDLWRRRYNADPAIVGRPVAINGRPYTIVGVLPPRVKFPFNQVAWVPLAPLAHESRRDERSLQVFARLRDGVTTAQAHDEMNAIARRLAGTHKENEGWSAIVRPLVAYYVPSEVRLVTMTAMGAVTLVLLIACANVANLLLARATVRSREMALRSAIGAGRWRIVRQLLTESGVLGLASVPLGIGVAFIGLGLFNSAMTFDDVPYIYSGWYIDTRLLLFTIAVALGTGMVFGMAPALQASRPNLVDALREGSRSGTGSARHRARGALVVGEVAVSLVLLVGASLFMRSFLNIQQASAGFDAANILTLRVYMPGAAYEAPGVKDARVADIVQRIGALAEVKAVGASNLIPLDGGGDVSRLEVEGLAVEAGRDRRTFYTGVTPRFFDSLDVPVVRGRRISDAEGETMAPVALVNVSFARRYFAGDRPAAATAETARLRGAADLGSIDPVGRRIRLLDAISGNEWLSVVGVVPDILVDEIGDSEPEPAVFVSYRHLETPNTGLIIRTTGSPALVTSAVRAAIKASDPGVPVFAVQTMEEVRRLGFWQFELFGWMFATFGGLAVVLASVGVYGVLAYSVSQRTHELGVRLALGASPATLRKMILAHGLRLAGFGIALGLVGAVAITRVIGSLLYDVTPTDPVSFGAVTAVLVTIAGLASYLPARKATRVDPLSSLRAE
jgi:predicted permease